MLENLRPFTFNEKLAGGMLVLFFPVALITAVTLRPGTVVTGEEFAIDILWRAGWLITEFVATCVTVATLFFQPDYHPSRLRMHFGRVLPLAALIVATQLSSVGYDWFSNLQMRKFATLHRAELEGQLPRAVIYRTGIPDGGVAIIRSPGRNPEGFSQPVMIDLTGERIKSCKPISNRDWSCHFD